MEFKIGDKVTVIDEELSGEVLKIDKEWVEFISDEGFEYRYPKSSLYSINEKNELNFSPASFKVESKEADRKVIRQGLRPIRLNSAKPTIDLHMEELMPNRMPQKNEVALQIQIEYAEKVVNRAINLKVRQLVFIHGMGSGVLREELRSMLTTKFPNVEYFDGNYQKYGQGATELIIHGLGR